MSTIELDFKELERKYHKLKRINIILSIYVILSVCIILIDFFA